MCYGRQLLQAWLLQDLNTIPKKLFSSVVIILTFGAQGYWFESCPDLKFLPCIYSFVSLLRTLFVRYDTFLVEWRFQQCFLEHIESGMRCSSHYNSLTLTTISYFYSGSFSHFSRSKVFCLFSHLFSFIIPKCLMHFLMFSTLSDTVLSSGKEQTQLSKIPLFCLHAEL